MITFDAVVGNPPYNAGEEALYQHFVLFAEKISPKFISLIMPAKWYTGGRNLDKFRAHMLKNTHIHYLFDYPMASDCFNDVQIEGGVCFYLWDKAFKGDCTITTRFQEKCTTTVRPLVEDGVDSFIRYNEQLSVFKKIKHDLGFVLIAKYQKFKKSC